jgi:hypothetical protein
MIKSIGPRQPVWKNSVSQIGFPIYIALNASLCHNTPMPKGPQGQKRPADVIGNAVHVMRIATGEIEDVPSKAPARAKGGKKGGAARALKLTDEQKADIARTAANAR